MTTESDIAPVRKELQLACSPAQAFATFTTGMGRWWPLATHSVGQEAAESVVVEGRVGGRIVERTRDGAEHVWGTVTAWQPAERFAFTWHPGRSADSAQAVDVGFFAGDGGCRVVLEHGDWQVLGDRAGDVREQYDSGWDEVFGQRYASAAATAVA